MFVLPPDEPDLGDLRPLTEAIEGLCAVLDGDREAIIVGLAEILQRRIAFENLKSCTESGHDAFKGSRA